MRLDLNSDPPPRSRLRSRVIGWIVVPLFSCAVLWACGVHLGARNPDAWYTVAMRLLLHPFSADP